jgi:hypothetical protein
VKPITMTPEEENLIRRDVSMLGREQQRLLIDEIDALRKLPVIETCGDCAYQRYARCNHVESPNPSPVFTAKMAKSPAFEWCPLRGGAQ